MVAPLLTALRHLVAQLGPPLLERLDVSQQPHSDAPAVHRRRRRRKAGAGGELVDTLARVAPARCQVGRTEQGKQGVHGRPVDANAR